MASGTRRRIRIDLVALCAAIVVVLVLLAGLLVQAQRAPAAGATAYPQLTQPPATTAVPTVAFIGDSYSAGTGSSGYDTRFSTLVSAYEGWTSQDFAYGGTGYLRAATTSARTGCGADYCPNYGEVIARVKDYNPTIVFVSGGRNDVGLSQPAVDSAISRFYADLRAALPDARLIVTSPVWAYSSPPPQLSSIARAVRASAQDAGGTYLDVGEPLVEDRSLVAKDGVHPNDRGHAALAQAIEVALSRSGTAASP